jgi:hypothetical protein
LKFHVKQWQDITSDPFVLNCVCNCAIEFDFEPMPARHMSNPEYKFSSAEQQAIDSEIAEFLSKRIIEQSHSEYGEIISPIFLRPKKETGKVRVIFNLKHLNEAVTYRKFKMDTLESAIKLMRPGCFMTSIDLRDAYYSVPITPEHRKYLKFMWRGVLYQFTSLPMGLTSSPRLFTKILKPVFATLRSRYGHCCSGYIDDSIYIEDTVKLSEEATLDAAQLITRLGFVVHPSKSVFEPTQILEFLGFLLNSRTMTVTLTSKKVTKIVAACEHLLKQKSITIRELASLIGTLVSTFPGVELGPLHYRTLEHDKDLALKRSNGNFDSEMSLSPPSIGDLKWWVSFLPNAYRTIDHGTPHITMTTDASQVGWGATVEGHHTQGLWDAHETPLHINILELFAIQFGLMALLDKFHDQHIRIMSDNTTAVSYINSMGGCQSRDCDNIARDIWSWAIARNNWLSASYTPGKHNNIADKLSREFNGTLEWKLSPAIFDKISYHFSKPSIDLFASRINHQLDTYVSWKPDPGASFVDAFTINWERFANSFAFPPFCLITRCLQKVVQEQATMIIVVPMWTTQVWFTRLLSLLIDHPKVFKVTRDVLSNPFLGNLHPLSHKLVLMACRISGIPSLTSRFLQKLPTSLCAPGNPALRNNIQLTLQNGPSFVSHGKLIQCDLL